MKSLLPADTPLGAITVPSTVRFLAIRSTVRTPTSTPVSETINCSLVAVSRMPAVNVAPLAEDFSAVPKS